MVGFVYALLCLTGLVQSRTHCDITGPPATSPRVIQAPLLEFLEQISTLGEASLSGLVIRRRINALDPAEFSEPSEPSDLKTQIEYNS